MHQCTAHHDGHQCGRFAGHDNDHEAFLLHNGTIEVLIWTDEIDKLAELRKDKS